MTTPDPSLSTRPAMSGPPTKHQLALMIWLAVFPTLTVLNLTLGKHLRGVTGRVLHPLAEHQPVARLPPRRPGQHVAPPVGVPWPRTGGGPPGAVAVAERREHAAVAVVPEDAEVGGVDRGPTRRAVRRLLAGDPADSVVRMRRASDLRN